MISRPLLVIASCLFILSDVEATTIHVAADGSGDAPTIAAAVLLAAAGDTVEAGCGDHFIAAEINLPRNIVIRSETGAPDCATLLGSDARHFTIPPFVNVTLEGLTLTLGEGEDGGSIFSRGLLTARDCIFLQNVATNGGAIYAELGGSVTLESCTFDQNAGGLVGVLGEAAGAGVCVVAGVSLSAVDCTFENNQRRLFSQSFTGGGVYAAGCSEVEITGCTFTRNEANGGGGIAADSSLVVVADCFFDRNLAFGGNAPGGVGGAIFLFDDLGSEISGSRFADNSAPQGGALRVEAGPLLQISDCDFTGNRADVAGAVQVRDASINMHNCFLIENRARAVGAIQLSDAAGSIDGTVIASNRATGERGGGIFAANSSLTLDHVTLHGNVAVGSGSGIFSSNSNVTLQNTIVSFGSGGPAVGCDAGTGIPVVRCSDVFGNAGGDWVDCIAGLELVESNFSADPLFCDAPVFDFTLRSTSPCAPPGLTGCGQVGALGVGCGPVSVEPTSWGRVKGLYR